MGGILDTSQRPSGARPVNGLASQRVRSSSHPASHLLKKIGSASGTLKIIFNTNNNNKPLYFLKKETWIIKLDCQNNEPEPESSLVKPYRARASNRDEPGSFPSLIWFRTWNISFFRSDERKRPRKGFFWARGRGRGGILIGWPSKTQSPSLRQILTPPNSGERKFSRAPPSLMKQKHQTFWGFLRKKGKSEKNCSFKIFVKKLEK